MTATALTAAPTGSQRFWRRPLVVALLVLLAGGALGAAAFAAEQRLFVWRPHVQAVSHGWRVEGSSGLRPQAPAIAGDHLAWGQGLYTCVMDLRTGETHVVGFAASGMSVWPPSIDSGSVAWMESPRLGGGGSLVWVYDISRGRRRHFHANGNAATTALADDRVVWFEGQGPPRVIAADLEHGTRSREASGADIEYPVLASGHLIGWLVTPPQGGLDAHLVDTHTGRSVDVQLRPSASAASVGDIQLAGTWLLWTVQGRTSTSILVYDTGTGRTRTVAEGAVEAPATDGRTVVWVAPNTSGVGATIRGVRTDGEPFIVARPSAWPSALAVGADRVAWTGEEDGVPILQTAELP